ncbi:hypothetical protein [Lacinutrix sp. Bg11-31]|uniref:hypothetical protein n=1 Tax=Lacinutrix sp. Bg11-31 TaxID=2057808 RepID=UPI0018E1ED05|nr:hypothetical protein [Lacinutrix sp. Bg11-31]
MKSSVEEALDYYFAKRKEIIDYVNGSKTLTAEEIIENGEEMTILEYKITALEVAKED